jgi:HEAT repeat protein
VLKRNYAYAAGEIDVACDLSQVARHLTAMLEAPEDDLRAVTAWAVGSLSAALRHQIDWAAIRTSAASDPDPLVRVEAVGALGKALSHWVDSTALDTLSQAVHDPDSRVRYVAFQSARLLAEFGGPTISIPEVFDSADYGVRFEWNLLQLALSERPSPLEREHFA